MATRIDQILPVVAPTRSVADQPKATSDDGTRFQEQLDRASSVEKPASSSGSQDDLAAEDDDGLGLNTEHDQDGAFEQNEVATPTEGEESIEQIPGEIESVAATDDILLSSAAVLAATPIVAGESNTEVETAVETESVLAVQPETSEENFEENAEAIPFATEVTATDEIAVDEKIVEGEKKTVPAQSVEQNPDADNTNPIGFVETSERTDEVIVSEKLQSSVQASQPSVDAEISGQDAIDLPNQPSTGNGAFQQPPGTEEVKQVEANSESTPETEKTTSNFVNQLDTLSRESTVNNDDVALAPLKKTATAESNTSNEPTLVIDRSSTSTSLDQPRITAEARTETDAAPMVDRSRFVQRVSGAIRSAKDQDGLVQLKLSPPELGTLRVEISVKQGLLTAKLETESVAARAVLLDNLPALRERLAEQEIRIEKFDVDVRDESRQQENASTGDRNSNNSPAGKANARASRRSEDQNNIPTPTNLAPVSSDLSDGLDVMI